MIGWEYCYYCPNLFFLLIDANEQNECLGIVNNVWGNIGTCLYGVMVKGELWQGFALYGVMIYGCIHRLSKFTWDITIDLLSSLAISCYIRICNYYVILVNLATVKPAIKTTSI